MVIYVTQRLIKEDIHELTTFQIDSLLNSVYVSLLVGMSYVTVNYCEQHI